MTAKRQGAKIESISEAIGLVLDGADPDSVGRILLDHQKELLEALAYNPLNPVVRGRTVDTIDTSDAHGKAYAEKYGGPGAGWAPKSMKSKKSGTELVHWARDIKDETGKVVGRQRAPSYDTSEKSRKARIEKAKSDPVVATARKTFELGQKSGKEIAGKTPRYAKAAALVAGGAALGTGIGIGVAKRSARKAAEREHYHSLVAQQHQRQPYPGAYYYG